MVRKRVCPSRVHKKSRRSKIIKNWIKKQRKSDTGISVNEQFQMPSQLSPEKDHEKNDIDLDLQPLEIEVDEEYKPLGNLTGRRIVDLTPMDRKLCDKRVRSQNEDYGPQAAEPDISVEEMQNRKVEFLKKLQNRASTEDKRRSIEKDAKGQHNNQLWRELRLDCLTASNFGKVIKRKNISPHNILKDLLYKNSNFMTVGILYGRTHEKEAIQKYEAANKVSVNECGFFIDERYNFLGASPDGLIADDGIAEVKCLSSVKDTLKDAVCSNSCYKGQLNITKRAFCDFIIHILITTSTWNEFTGTQGFGQKLLTGEYHEE
ncbi:Viral alkaline exonuclease [Popillia japonica]|uniref:Viral alkaline exonuclease n=1 Tax=Popillia japonica TaxID=7064 RepID=A0AAW1MDZ8_POPJA